MSCNTFIYNPFFNIAITAFCYRKTFFFVCHMYHNCHINIIKVPSMQEFNFTTIILNYA